MRYRWAMRRLGRVWTPFTLLTVGLLALACSAPSAEPSETATSTAIPIVAATAAPEPTPTPEPATPTATPEPEPTDTPAATPTHTVTPTPEPEPTDTPVATPTETATPTPQPTRTPTPLPSPTPESQVQGQQEAQVVRVIDGDTIEVEMAGMIYTVRYIGVDTPETVHPSRGVEPYGPEASEFNRQLVEGETVLLEKDVSETDRFGRLLRYVYVDGVMVNATLIAEGLAQVSTFPPDVKYTEMFLELQEQARNAGVGMWSDAEPVTATPAAEPPTVTPTAEPQRQPDGDCDPSYPGVCIPPPPPDLNCPDITYRNFEVLPPDPHRFDGNRDGVGCES